MTAEPAYEYSPYTSMTGPSPYPLYVCRHCRESNTIIGGRSWCGKRWYECTHCGVCTEDDLSNAVLTAAEMLAADFS